MPRGNRLERFATEKLAGDVRERVGLPSSSARFDGGETPSRARLRPLTLLARLEEPGRRVLRFTRDANFDEDEGDAYSGGLHVARIYTDLNIDAETVWRWGLQDIHAGPDITEIGGTAGSLEEAKAAVYKAFRNWLAWAEL